MARTSPVLMFSAMTDGSLSTIPRPRAYTRVLAVPRSMARSLATVTTVVFVLVRRERTHLSLELFDAVVERGAPAVAHPEHERADAAHEHRDEEKGKAAGHPSTSLRSVAARPQSSPPSQRSFFQMGTVA